MKNPRELWTPKLKEISTQCVSCPFRQGNDSEFADVVNRLRAKDGLGPATAFVILEARWMIRQDVTNMGDFVCHGTAYDRDMNLRPRSENMQCPGASAHHMSEGERLASEFRARQARKAKAGKR